jgi:hypothetical protein
MCASINVLPGWWTPTRKPAPTQAWSVPSQDAPAFTEKNGSVCIRDLNTALEQSENTYLPGSELETDFTLVTYTVSGDTILDPVNVDPIPPRLKSFQDDIAAQQKLWDFFVDIIPSDRRTQVTQFSVFTDGPNNSLGAVEQTDDPRHWKLEMDIQDGQNFADLSTTLIHEFAHLLTLSEAQVIPDLQVFDHPHDREIYDQAATACSTYFMFEGCSLPDSYINKFYRRFWPDLYAEWQKIDALTDEDVQDEKLGRFYDLYADQFLSSYAVTSPAEDIAESFMYFIFTPQPVGRTIAQQKVLFFYDYPELKSLRQHILSHLCRYVEK